MSNAEEVARGLRRPRASKAVGEVADWMNCNAELLQKVIATAGAKHCALRFGYSRDGGAYSVGVYAGTDYFTDYIRPGEEVDDYLRDLLISLEEYRPEEGLESASQRKKGRK